MALRISPLITLLIGVLCGFLLQWLMPNKEGFKIGKTPTANNINNNVQHDNAHSAPLNTKGNTKDKNNHLPSGYTFVHQHRSKPSILHRPNSPMDACNILQVCYPGTGGIFATQQECHKNMLYMDRYFDNTAIVSKESGGIVGYISLQSQRLAPQKASITIYNVCIAPSHRGLGLATSLINHAIEDALDWHRLRDDKVLLALDVNLNSQWSHVAFAMYAKLGYLRGWQPCGSVGYLDFLPLFDGESDGGGDAEDDNKNIVHPHPLSQILARPLDYQRSMRSKDDLSATSPRLPLRHAHYPDGNDHYCMFKFYGDGWIEIGKILSNYHQPE